MKIPGDSLAALYFINTLFADLTGHDLYLAQQIQAGIEQALGEEAGKTGLSDQHFISAVAELVEKTRSESDSFGFSHWNCRTGRSGFEPLWARQEAISILKKLAPYPRATLLVTGLREAVRPPGRRWSRRLHREYTEAVEMIQDLARQWTTPSAEVTLLVL